MTDHDPDGVGEIALDVAPALDEAAARAITDQIRQSVESLRELVVTAYRGRAWVALKYPTWHEYCDQEFGHRLRLPSDEREKIVHFLRDAELSIRAIASALGISPQTVQSDLAGVSNQHSCDETNSSALRKPSISIAVDPLPASPTTSDSGDSDSSSNGPVSLTPKGTTNGKSVGLDGKNHPKKKRRITPRLNESLAGRFDVQIAVIRTAARSIDKMCRTYNWAAPHAELRVTLKLLQRVVEIIEQVLAGPEQTTIYDHHVGSDEEIEARIDARLPLNGTTG